MARPRDPRRDQAYNIWKESKGSEKLKDIAEELSVSPSQVRKWKSLDSWTEKLNGNVTNQKTKSNGNVTKRGAPKGSKNARGNKGGKAPQGNKNAKGNSGGAAPKGNKNALNTGEYESIFGDVLTDEEQGLFGQIDTTPLLQVDENLRLLSIRERRMLKRIADVIEGMNEKERRILQEKKTTKVPVEVHDDKTGKTKIVTTRKDELVITELEETEYRKIDDVLKLEEALTRVQDKKLKAIKLKYEMSEMFNHRKNIDDEKLAIEKMKAESDQGKDGNEELVEDWVKAVMDDD